MGYKTDQEMKCGGGGGGGGRSEHWVGYPTLGGIGVNIGWLPYPTLRYQCFPSGFFRGPMPPCIGKMGDI